MAKTKKKKKEKEERSDSSLEKPRIKYYSEPTSLQKYMGFPTIEEQERETKRKRGERIRKDIGSFLDRPLISKARRTTKSKGRALKVSAQAGIRGFWR